MGNQVVIRLQGIQADLAKVTALAAGSDRAVAGVAKSAALTTAGLRRQAQELQKSVKEHRALLEIARATGSTSVRSSKDIEKALGEQVGALRKLRAEMLAVRSGALPGSKEAAEITKVIRASERLAEGFRKSGAAARREAEQIRTALRDKKAAERQAAAFERSFQRLQDRLTPGGAAARRYADGIQSINRAYASGLISGGQAANLTAKLAREWRSAGSALGFLKEALGASRFGFLAMGGAVAAVGAASFALGTVTSGVRGITSYLTEATNKAIEFQRSMAKLSSLPGANPGPDFERTAALADQYGLSIDSLISIQARYMVSANEAGMTDRQRWKTFEQLAVAIAAAGSGSTQAELAMRALSQMLDKGAIRAEELVQQLSDHIPGAIGRMQRAVGAVDKQELFAKMKAGALSSLEVMQLFAAQMEEDFGPAATKWASSQAAEFQRAENSMARLKLEIGQAMLPELAELAKGVKAWLDEFRASKDAQASAASIAASLRDVGSATVSVTETLQQLGLFDWIRFEATRSAAAVSYLSGVMATLANPGEALAPMFPAAESAPRAPGRPSPLAPVSYFDIPYTGGKEAAEDERSADALRRTLELKQLIAESDKDAEKARKKVADEEERVLTAVEMVAIAQERINKLRAGGATISSDEEKRVLENARVVGAYNQAKQAEKSLSKERSAGGKSAREREQAEQRLAAVLRKSAEETADAYRENYLTRAGATAQEIRLAKARATAEREVAALAEESARAGLEISAERLRAMVEERVAGEQLRISTEEYVDASAQGVAIRQKLLEGGRMARRLDEERVAFERLGEKGVEAVRDSYEALDEVRESGASWVGSTWIPLLGSEAAALLMVSLANKEAARANEERVEAAKKAADRQKAYIEAVRKSADENAELLIKPWVTAFENVQSSIVGEISSALDEVLGLSETAAGRLAKLFIDAAIEAGAAWAAQRLLIAAGGGGVTSNAYGGYDVGGIAGLIKKWFSGGSASSVSGGSQIATDAATLDAAAAGTSTTASSVAAILGTVAVFYAAYALGTSLLEKQKKKQTSGTVSLGVTQPGDFVGAYKSDSLNAEMVRIWEETQEAFQALEDITGGTIRATQRVQINLKGTGEAFVHIGDYVQKFSNLADAVAFAQRELIRTADLAGIPAEIVDLIRQGGAEDLGQLARDIELINRALGRATTDMDRTFAAMLEQFLQDSERLGELRVGTGEILADLIDAISELADDDGFEAAAEKLRDKIRREIAYLEEELRKALENFGRGPGGRQPPINNTGTRPTNNSPGESTPLFSVVGDAAQAVDDLARVSSAHVSVLQSEALGIAAATSMVVDAAEATDPYIEELRRRIADLQAALAAIPDAKPAEKPKGGGRGGQRAGERDALRAEAEAREIARLDGIARQRAEIAAWVAEQEERINEARFGAAEKADLLADVYLEAANKTGNAIKDLVGQIGSFTDGPTTGIEDIRKEAERLRKEVAATPWKDWRKYVETQKIDLAEKEKLAAIENDLVGQLFGYLEGSKEYEADILHWKEKQLELEFAIIEAQLKALGVYDQWQDLLGDAFDAAWTALHLTDDDEEGDEPDYTPPHDYQGEIDAYQDILSRARDAQSGLQEWLNNLGRGPTESSGLTASQRLAEAQRQYNLTLAAAQSGEVGAIQNLDDVAQALLDAEAAMTGTSSAAFGDLRDLITAQLAAVSTMYTTFRESAAVIPPFGSGTPELQAQLVIAQSSQQTASRLFEISNAAGLQVDILNRVDARLAQIAAGAGGVGL